jgi:chromate reductase, NAD(P)H dehydrogenase (quinone)
VAHILLVCGSVRAGSTNAAALATAAAVAPADITTATYDGLHALPHFNPDLDGDPLPRSVAELRAAIAAADGVLFSTPEYAGALPGAMKNLLDWTVGGIETSDKPVGWLNISSAPSGAAGAHAELATVLRYTDARLVDAACVRIPVGREQVVNGLVEPPASRAAIAAALTALADAAAGGVQSTV